MKYKGHAQAQDATFFYQMRCKAPRFSAGDIRRGFDFLLRECAGFCIAPYGAVFLLAKNHF
jgi:hypothetical protein